MNTKESIEFLAKMNISGDELLKMKIKNVKKLAKKLQRGEKYEQMFKKLEREFVEREAELFLIIKRTRKYKKMWKELCTWHNKFGIGNLSEAIKELEQKYFPKVSMIK